MLVDANVLLRLITKHPEDLYEGARSYVQRCEVEGRRLSVHPMHVAEVVFVLEGQVYGLTPKEAAQEILHLLSLEVLDVLDGAALLETLRRYPDSNLDFPDVFLVELARTMDTGIVSFDRKIQRMGIPMVVPAAE